MKGNQIRGEYKRVSCLTRLPIIMAEANSTLIVVTESYALLEKLKLEFPCVPFETNLSTKDQRGHASIWQGRISLPIGNGQIRIGLVLHEFAHIYHGSMGIGGSGHGPEFVECLDRILEFWYLSLT